MCHNGERLDQKYPTWLTNESRERYFKKHVNHVPNEYKLKNPKRWQSLTTRLQTLKST